MTARYVIVVFSLASVLIGAEPGKALEVHDVCEAKAVARGNSIRIRGTGRFAPDGFVLGDVTCPIGRSGEIRIPAMVLLEINSFQSSAEAGKYEHDKKRALSADPIAQLVAEGDLTCVDVAFRRSDNSQIIGGNGYGTKGLIACKLSRAKVIDYQWILDAATPTAPPK